MMQYNNPEMEHKMQRSVVVQGLQGAAYMRNKATMDVASMNTQTIIGATNFICNTLYNLFNSYLYEQWSLNQQNSDNRVHEAKTILTLQKREAITQMPWHDILGELRQKVGLFFVTSCTCDGQKNWWDKQVFRILQYRIKCIVEKFYDKKIYFRPGVIKDATDINMYPDNIIDIIFATTSDFKTNSQTAGQVSPPIIIIKCDVIGDYQSFENNDALITIGLSGRRPDGQTLKKIDTPFIGISADTSKSADKADEIINKLSIFIVSKLVKILERI